MPIFSAYRADPRQDPVRDCIRVGPMRSAVPKRSASVGVPPARTKGAARLRRACLAGGRLSIGAKRAGDPGRARTYDLPLRRRLLYPAELRGLTGPWLRSHGAPARSRACRAVRPSLQRGFALPLPGRLRDRVAVPAQNGMDKPEQRHYMARVVGGRSGHVIRIHREPRRQFLSAFKRLVLGDSLTVEQRTLTPLVVVRIHVPQPPLKSST